MPYPHHLPHHRRDRPTPVVRIDRSPLRVDAGLGRLYVSGTGADRAMTMPGAAFNERRGAFELSLTLETLRALRRTLGLTSEQLAEACTDTVMRWARAANTAETAVTQLHARIADGFRTELPWRDVSGHPVTGAYRAPYDHQKIMATVACELDGSVFTCEVGTGKTRAGAEAGQHKVRTGEVDQILVVCPNNALGTWEREIPNWAPLLNVIVLEGPTASRVATMQRNTRRGVVFVTNYEAIDRMKVGLLAWARSRKVGLLMDEMHRAKNPNAAVTKALMNLAQRATWRLGMTGTPICNGAEDVWSQWYMIDYGTAFGANFVQFRREFFIENPFQHDLQPRHGTLDEVGLRMRRRAVRYRKDDCLDLPERVYVTREVDMTPAQARAYDTMRDDLVASLGDNPDDVATAATQLSSIMRLMQITSGFVPKADTGEIFRFTPNPKLSLLTELVNDHVTDQQIIVWAHYREDHDAIMQALARHNPRLLRGGVKRAEKDAVELAFARGEVRVIVAQQQAAGTALNLQASSLAIYYSQNYSLIDRTQSEGRNHRSGSEIHDHVTYIDLGCRGTVDAIVRAALQRKTTVAEVVVDLRNHLGL